MNSIQAIESQQTREMFFSGLSFESGFYVSFDCLFMSVLLQQCTNLDQEHEAYNFVQLSNGGFFKRFQETDCMDKLFTFKSESGKFLSLTAEELSLTVTHLALNMLAWNSKCQDKHAQATICENMLKALRAFINSLPNCGRINFAINLY